MSSNSKFCKQFKILLFFCCLHLANCSSLADPQVFIDNDEFKGSIVGKQIQDTNSNYLAFRGIPYAKPPIKDLRFRDPQKPTKFKGTFEATQDGFECYSVMARNASEDCLNLNVYTKQLNASSPLLPVVVLIHPGGLYLGSAASFFMHPSHMMTQDLVLVTFNYRLGALGFLNLGTAEIPGNAGFKDQVFALRWVQKFIQNFGGNPKDVTLMGYSAGALSVQLHMMSPLSEKLFHKAIIMSGSLPPQTHLAQQQKYLAVRLAKRLNCPQFLTINEEIPYGRELKFSDYEDVNNEDILQCFQQHNGSVIGNSLRGMFDVPYDNPIFLWLPVLENDFQQERFLASNFTVQAKNLLIGYTNGELCESAKYIFENDFARKKFSQEFLTLAPRIFMYERHPARDSITEQITQKYFNGSTNFTTKDYDAICDLFSDAIIRFGENQFAEFLANKKQGKVYFYEFSFVHKLAEQDNGFPEKQDRCEHMSDFQYLFNWTGRKHDSAREKKMVDSYTGFIYDFVKNGKLTAAKAQLYPQAYASISDNIEFKEGRNFKNYDFWHHLFPMYFNFNLK